MSETPNEKNDQDQLNVSDILESQKKAKEATEKEERIKEDSIINNVKNGSLNLEDNIVSSHHHHGHHRRKMCKWQKITWGILCAISVIACAAAFLISEIPSAIQMGIVIFFVVLMAFTSLYSFHKYHRKGRRIVITVNTVIITLFVLTGCFGLIAFQQVKKVKPLATELKNDLGTVMTDIKNDDPDAAEQSLTELNKDNDELQADMNHFVWKAAAKLPVVGKQVESVVTVTDVVDEASDKVIHPLIDQMKQDPLSGLKVGEHGFNVNMINSYLDFMDGARPALSDMNDKIQGLDLSLTGQEDMIDSYKQTFKGFMDDYDKYIPVLRAFLGDGSTDKHYLFVAQNLSEGRTTGGFPGSAGIITVSNGVMEISDFESISYLIPHLLLIPSDVEQSDEEKTLFDNKMVSAWDANYTPDFARAGQIWARSYEDQNNATLDGVVSLTPTVIQNALKIFNTDITLSDGTQLNGANTAQMLSYDLYYKYFGQANGLYWQRANDITDSLFSETASKAEDILTGDFSISNLDKYKELANSSIEDGTFLMWFKNADEEKAVVNAGMSGILTNGESTNNSTGFYWSFDSGCKMGWFMDLTSQVSTPIENGDGTTSYEVTVAMSNIITNADIANGSTYILGTYNGNLQGQLHLTAPAGGSISDITIDNGTELTESTYEGLQMFYNNRTVVAPGDTMHISYTVTTAKGIKGLNLHVTPSLTNYRNN